jgi:hypothetical protein
VAPDGTQLSKSLGALLAMKTRAAYGATRVSAEQRRRASRAAQKLVDEARLRRAR